MPKTSRTNPRQLALSSIDTFATGGATTTSTGTSSCRCPDIRAEDAVLQTCDYFPRLHSAPCDPSYNPDPQMDYVGLCYLAANTCRPDSSNHSTEIRVGLVTTDLNNSKVNGGSDQTAPTNRLRKYTSVAHHAKARLFHPALSSANYFEVLSVGFSTGKTDDYGISGTRMETSDAKSRGRQLGISSPAPTDMRPDDRSKDPEGDIMPRLANARRCGKKRGK